MFEYGSLRFVEGDINAWLFIKGSEDIEELGKEGFVETLNKVGAEGWELIELEPEVGYMFKRKVVKQNV